MATKLEVFASELGLGIKAASAFARNVETLLGMRCSYSDLLLIVPMVVPPVTAEKLAAAFHETHIFRTLADSYAIDAAKFARIQDAITMLTRGLTVDPLYLLMACQRLRGSDETALVLDSSLHLLWSQQGLSAADLPFVLDGTAPPCTPPPTTRELLAVLQHDAATVKTPEEIVLQVVITRLRKLRFASGSFNGFTRRLHERGIPLNLPLAQLAAQEAPSVQGPVDAWITNLSLRVLLAKRQPPHPTPEAVLQNLNRRQIANLALSPRLLELILRAIQPFEPTMETISIGCDMLQYLLQCAFSETESLDILRRLCATIRVPVPLARVRAALITASVLSKEARKKRKSKRIVLSHTQLIVHIRRQVEDEYYRAALRTLLKPSDQQIDTLLMRLQQRLGTQPTVAQIYRACRALAPRTYTLDDIVGMIEEQAALQQITKRITPLTLDQFATAVSSQLGTHVSERTIRQLLPCIPSDSPVDLVAEMGAYVRLDQLCTQEPTMQLAAKSVFDHLQPHFSQLTYQELYDVVAHVRDGHALTLAGCRQWLDDTRQVQRVAAHVQVPVPAVERLIAHVQEIAPPGTMISLIARAIEHLGMQASLPEIQTYLGLAVQLKTAPTREREPVVFVKELRFALNDHTLSYESVRDLLTTVPLPLVSVANVTMAMTLMQRHPTWDQLWHQTREQLPESLSLERFHQLLCSYRTPTLVTAEELVLGATLLPTGLVTMLGTPTADEAWLTSAELRNRGMRTLPQPSTPAAFDAYAAACWETIASPERHYAVPSAGQAIIRVAPIIMAATGVERLQFFQEYCQEPSVTVRLAWAGGGMGMARIGLHGEVSSPVRWSMSDHTQAIVRSLLLAYYRDLVCPDTPYQHQGDSKAPALHTTHSPVTHPQRRPMTRSLPRRLRDDPETSVVFDAWYQAQFRAQHAVTGHAREVGAGFIAEPEKYEAARRAGVLLKPGYTWVMEHQRGRQDATADLLDGTDLAAPTTFAPPTRASAELERLLGKRS